MTLWAVSKLVYLWFLFESSFFYYSFFDFIEIAAALHFAPMDVPGPSAQNPCRHKEFLALKAKNTRFTWRFDPLYPEKNIQLAAARSPQQHRDGDTTSRHGDMHVQSRTRHIVPLFRPVHAPPSIRRL